MDREKVIKGLEEAETMLKQAVDRGGEMAVMGAFKCLNHVSDALALLKESERKTGSWDYGTQCSVCKGTIVPPWKRDTRVNFCPWCGADMRGGYDA